MTLRNTDVVLSASMLALLGLPLFAWQLASEALALPNPDGARAIATVGDLLGWARVLDFGQIRTLAANARGDFFNYVVFAVPSLIFGPSRVAFGVVSVVCLAVLLVSIWRVTPERHRKAPCLLAFSLVLVLGLFQSEVGGARDTRLDLLPTTLVLFSMALMISGKPFWAGVVAAAAAFGNATSVSLLLPVAVVASLLGLVQVRVPDTRAALVRSAVLMVLAAGFFAAIGRQAISANLRATGAADLRGQVRYFVTDSFGRLSQDPTFYWRDLSDSYHARLLLFVALVALLLDVRFVGLRGTTLRIGVVGMAAFVSTYLLLSGSPVRSNNLTIWFLPSVAILAVYVSVVASYWLDRTRIMGITGGLFAISLLGLQVRPTIAANAVLPVNDVVEQASDVADFLAQRFHGQTAGVIVLTNFRSADGPLVNTFDVYRVLIGERTSATNLILNGLEIGSDSTDWHAELLRQQAYQHIVFIVQENPMGIPDDNSPQRLGAAVRSFLLAYRDEHPGCLIQAARSIVLPRIGERQAWMLSETADCRAALFAP